VNGFLLDTNCISEFMSLRPERRVLDWLDGTDERLLFLSVLTLGEVRKGIEGAAPGKRRARLESWLEVELPARFAGRVLPIDHAVADRWGSLAAAGKRRGRPLATIDGLLAATALEHDLALVSRNVGDFAGIGLSVLNPWDLT
jgi:predicted nucleic acid-binding protein